MDHWIEKVNITAGKLSANTDIDLENGMAHFFTTTEDTTCTPNIRVSSSKALNDVMSIGDVISVSNHHCRSSRLFCTINH